MYSKILSELLAEACQLRYINELNIFDPIKTNLAKGEPKLEIRRCLSRENVDSIYI